MNSSSFEVFSDDLCHLHFFHQNMCAKYLYMKIWTRFPSKYLYILTLFILFTFLSIIPRIATMTFSLVKQNVLPFLILYRLVFPQLLNHLRLRDRLISNQQSENFSPSLSTLSRSCCVCVYVCFSHYLYGTVFNWFNSLKV